MNKLGMAAVAALSLGAGWLQAQQQLPTSLAADKAVVKEAPRVESAAPAMMNGCNGGCNGCSNGNCNGCCNGNCNGGCTDCFNSCGCGPDLHIWGAADLLLWDLKDNRLPLPLVTVGSTQDLIPGAIGQPGTRVVWGGDSATDLGGDLLPGVRIRGGAFSNSSNLGGEVTFFWVETHTDGINATPAFFNVPVIAQPVFNTLNNISDSLVDSNPPGLLGGVNIKLRSKFWGAEANATLGTGNALNGSLLLAGFKFLDLDDDISFVSGPRVVGIVGNTPLGPGGFNLTQESLTTRNRFYGGQVGAQQSWCWNGLTVTGRAALALGASDQEVIVRGVSGGYDAAGNLVTSLPGGLLTGQSNLGTHDSTHFAVVPSVDLTVGYRLTENILAYVGYNCLYWTNVVRPGENLDLNVDPRGSPLSNVYDPTFIAARPAVPFDTTSFWVQGFNLGVGLSW